MSFSDERAEQLRAETEKAYNEALAAAKKLSEIRIEAGKKFSADVERELAFLDMPSVKFIVNDSVGKLYENGIDNIEFLLSANAGEEPKPLSKIASGGELSRISLAIEVAALGLDAVPTMVFDEVDSGIGGAVSDIVGRKLRALGEKRQVLAVTHLPQVAAQGHAHYRVSKAPVDGMTQSAVEKLGAKQREEELARMLGGVEVSKEAHAAAKRLLANAV